MRRIRECQGDIDEFEGLIDAQNAAYQQHLTNFNALKSQWEDIQS